MIDIKKSLYSKNPALGKKLPKPVFSLLERIIHQKEINSFLLSHKNDSATAFISAIIDYLDLKINVINEERIPESGKYIFVSNHPLGGLDGIILAHLLEKRYKEKFCIQVNDLLLGLEQLTPLFVPVNKHGKLDRKCVLQTNDLLRSDKQLLVFPAGLVSRKQQGIVRDLDWSTFFLKKAVAFERDIIPIHFVGKNSAFFYNLASFRKKAGINFNIEMLFLPREMFLKRGEELEIRIGNCIKWESLKDEPLLNKEKANTFRELIYNI